MNPKTTRGQRLSMLVSVREAAMMAALAERDARTVSDVIRELVRREFTVKFNTAIPVIAVDTGQTYIWERAGEEYRLHAAGEESVTPLATLIRSGHAFRVARAGREWSAPRLKQLAQAAGIEVVS